MSLQDPIADMLTRIRNGYMVSKTEVAMPSSKIKVAIARVLRDEGYIIGFTEEGETKRTLKVSLKYYEGKSVIEKIQRVSRSGLRRYEGKDSLPKIKDGLGVAIISTCKGIMSDKAAREAHVGGEVLCYVY